MYKKAAFGVIGFLVAASPFLVSAQSTSDVAAQIQALLAQIQALQTQLLQLQAQSSTQSGQSTQSTQASANSSSTSCVDLVSSIGLDDTDADTDGDVSKLQQFLKNAGVYSGSISGHVGPATIRGVQKWQASHGLISYGDPDTTGYGNVGPKTRAAMSCANLSINQPLPVKPTFPRPRPSGNFYATPNSGAAPLSVTFTAQNIDPSSASIDFGDGTQVSCASDMCAGSNGWTTPHIYTSAGTYTARLLSSFGGQVFGSSDCTGNCATIAGIASQSDTRVMGVTTITVGTAPRASLTVASPTGGTFQAGNTLQIVWNDPTATPATRYYITLWPTTYPQGSGWGISPTAPNGDSGNLQGSSYSWTIDSRPSAGAYFVRVCRLGEDVCGASQTIQISAQSGTTDSVVSAWLTDPTGNGKETFSAGDQLGINWSVVPFRPDSQYQTSIELFPYGANAGVTPTTRVMRVSPAARGNALWTVSKNGLFGDMVTSGRYYVYVDAYDSQKGGYVVGVAGPITLNITSTSTPTQLPQPSVSLPGTASLNGTNQYVPLSPIGDSLGFTVSAWTWYSGAGSCSVIFSDGDSTGGNDVVFGVDATSAYLRADKTGTNLSGNACAPLGTMQLGLGKNIAQGLHHLVWVNTGAKSILYVDGVEAQRVPYAGSNIGFHVASPSVGRMSDGVNGSYPHGIDYFKGSIADFRYYNSALSADQVAQLYAAGANGAGSITPSTDSGTVISSGNVGSVVVAGSTVSPAGISVNTQNVTLGTYTLAAGNTENVFLDTLKFTIRAVGSSDYSRAGTDISNLKVTVNGTSYPVATVSSGLYSIYSATFPQGLQIPKGTTVSLTIAGDIGASRGGSVDLWSDKADFALRGESSGATISPTSTNSTDTHNFYWSGYRFITAGDTTAAAAGSLTVGLDASSPSAGNVIAGSTVVPIGAFRVSASGESVTLNRMDLAFDYNMFTPADLNQVTIWDGGTQVGTAIVLPSGRMGEVGYTATAAISRPVTIPKDGYKVLTIKADIASVGRNQAGTEGDLLRVSVIGATGVGVTSGSNIVFSKKDASPAQVMRIFRTLPTVVAPVAGTPTTLVQGTQELYRFSVTANPAGDVGLNRVTVNIGVSSASSAMGSVTVSNVKLVAYDQGGNPAPPFANGVVSVNSASSASGDIALTVNQSGQSVLEIPAGQTYTFKVFGTVSQTPGTAGSAGSVTTKLLMDTVPTIGMGPVTGMTFAMFLWSPNTMTTSAVTDSNWVSGSNIPGGANVTSVTLSNSGGVGASAGFPNLANSLTALETALKAIQGMFAH